MRYTDTRSWEERLAELRREFCKILAKIDALKFGTFTLTSGAVSPYYVDLRLVFSYPGALREVTKFYVELVENEVGLDNFDRIAAIPTAGIPYSTALALELRKPLIYVRKEVKRHGRERRVEGILRPGDRILIVDDLVTTGTTIVNTAEALRAEGGIVEHGIVLVDREEGSGDALAEAGVRLHCLVKISEAAKIMYELGKITSDQYRTVLQQVEARRSTTS